MAFNIPFKKSGKTFEWEGRFNSLLDFAEDMGISLENGCRIGTCGTCKVKLISGSVTMETEEGLDDSHKAGGMILPCVAVPESDLVIDA